MKKKKEGKEIILPLKYLENQKIKSESSSSLCQKRIKNKMCAMHTPMEIDM